MKNECPHIRAGETLIDLLMGFVAPVFGGIAVGLVLIKLTPLPFWACLLIALPVGTIVGWAVMFGIFGLLGRIFDSGRKKDD
jgi:hypothetical protein